MTLTWLFDLLLAWSAQICVLLAVAAGVAIVLQSPRGRLIFWQNILVIVLLLPAVEPWASTGGASGAVGISTGLAIVEPARVGHSILLFRRDFLLIGIVAGMVLRLIWIGIGLARLRRHRLASQTWPTPPVPLAKSRVAWYLSSTISGPATYGWIRPSILLPSNLFGLPEELQQAVACHELVHVLRRDWLFVLVEEWVRAMFWFHPAVWFLLSRIQLAREQVVDLETIQLTGNREGYLDALVAVAEQQFFRGVTPAPLFLRKRHLAARVAAILQGVKMSKSRIVAQFATVSSVSVAAVCLAVWLFPMQSPAQAVPSSGGLAGDDPAMTIDAGGSLMHRAPIHRAVHATSGGTVIVDAMLDSKGEVADAHVVSGPDELRNAVLQSVLQWHYSNPGPQTVRIVVRFDQIAARTATASPAAPSTPEEMLGTLKTIEFVGVAPDIQEKVRAVLPVREGDTVSRSFLANALDAARQVDEHFRARTTRTVGHQVIMTFLLGPPPAAIRVVSADSAKPEPGTTAFPPSTMTPSIITVGGNVAAFNLIYKVTPMYPMDAKRSGVQGKVILAAMIGATGKITHLDLISGDPLLAPAAMQAVKQWVYKPTLLEGRAVEVVTQIEVNFTLSQ
jgi:TonB family protein